MSIDRVIYLLNEDAKGRETIITTGACNDYIQYRTVVTELKTIRSCIDTIKRVMVEGEEDEDPDPDV